MNRFAYTCLAVTSSVLCTIAAMGMQNTTEHSRLPSVDFVAQRQSAELLIRQANVLRRDNLSGHSPLLRKAAAVYQRIGDSWRAIDVLDEVIIAPETPFDHVSALRMKAQSQVAVGRSNDAITTFGMVIDGCDADPQLKSIALSDYLSACTQLANILHNQNRLRESLTINGKGLASLKANEPLFAPGLLNRHSRVLEQYGLNAEALLILDQLLGQFPTYGYDDGYIVRLHLRRAELLAPDAHGSDRTRLVAEIWNNPLFRTMPAVIDAGRELLTLFKGNNQSAEAIQTMVEMVHLIEDHQAMWTSATRPSMVGARSPEDWSEMHSSLLAVLSSADAYGKPNEALWAIDRLLHKNTSPDERASLIRQQQAILKAVSETQTPLQAPVEPAK